MPLGIQELGRSRTRSPHLNNQQKGTENRPEAVGTVADGVAQGEIFPEGQNGDGGSGHCDDGGRAEQDDGDDDRNQDGGRATRFQVIEWRVRRECDCKWITDRTVLGELYRGQRPVEKRKRGEKAERIP